MANSTVLSLVQSFCREYGLNVPTSLAGSSDAGALQMRELIQTVGEDLWAFTNWRDCGRTAVWTSVAGSDQGLIDTLFPDQLSHIIPQTFWDQTMRIQVTGPLSDYNWQTNRSLGLATPSYYYRVTQGHLYMQATMPAGHTLSLIYKSKYWVESSGSPAMRFSTDNDTCIFPDSLVKKGLRAFWLRVKQMPHKFEFEAYELARAQEAATNTIAPILHYDAVPYSGQPGVIIPLGNWTI